MKRRVTAHTRWITVLTTVALVGCESTIWVPSAPPRDVRDASLEAEGAVIAHDAPEVNGVTFEDDFTRGLGLWEPFGEPEPMVLRDTLERPAVFDNHGDGDCNSGALSADVFDLSRGFTLEAELRLDVTNLAGCWVSADLAVARETTDHQCLSEPEPSDMVRFGVHYVGDACWNARMYPRQLRHAWVVVSINTEFGEYATWAERPPSVNFVTTLPGDELLDAWHRFTIRVDAEGWADYLIDGRRFTRAPGRLTPRSGEDWTRARVMVFGRSSGSAGRAYATRVRLSVPSPP